jgi:hypothetical protein
VYLAALKVIQQTLNRTRSHSDTFVQLKVTNILVGVLDYQSSNDKMKLSALGSLNELSHGGYHMAVLDMSVINSIHRILTKRAQCLIPTALEIV